MGWDATFYFPAGTKRAAVEHFLTLIGYRRAQPDSVPKEKVSTDFFYPANSDPARLSEVTASIYEERGALVAASRTNIWCTYRDTEIQNQTLRELKTFFNGYFVSDLGRNRYFKNTGPKREGLEAACYTATFVFLNSITKIKLLNDWISQKKDFKPSADGGIAVVNLMNPIVLASNLSLVYLVSLLEDFFKTLFLETLNGPNRPTGTIRNIKPALLERLLSGQIGIPEAIAESTSFQNAESIRRHFSSLPQVGFIAKFLGKPISSKRRITRAEALQKIFDRRHRLVHQAEIDPYYLPADLARHVRFCERIVSSLYRGLTRANSWPYETSDLL
jgi:hypothetical protein